MLKKILFALTLTTPAFASTRSYRLNLAFQSGNANSITRTVVVREGDEGKFIFENKVIRFIPTRDGTNAVKISSTFFENGEIVSRLSAVVRLHETAEVSQSDANGNKLFSLKWTPELSLQ